MNNIKLHFKHVLRTFRVLKAIDYLMLIGNRISHLRSNRHFRKVNPGFRPPPAHLAFDAYNHTSWSEYDEMGRIHAKLIQDLMQKHLTQKKIHICEWGCGPARVIRHLGEITNFYDLTIYGTDYNEETIKWCKQAYPNVRFYVNHLEPPLPFEKETFHCIYAISVFTHLSEQLYKKWLHELLRVVKKEGIIIFTTHGERSASRLLPSDRKKFNSTAFIEHGNYKEGKKHFVSYQSPEYIRETLQDKCIVAEHISRADSYQLGQEVWVIKKNDSK